MADRVVSKVMNNLYHLTYETITGKEDHVFDVLEYSIRFNPLLAIGEERKVDYVSVYGGVEIQQRKETAK